MSASTTPRFILGLGGGGEVASTFMSLTVYPSMEFQEAQGRARMKARRNQEDRGKIKELGWTAPSCFGFPWSSWPSFWLFLGSLELLQGIYFQGNEGKYYNVCQAKQALH